MNILHVIPAFYPASAYGGPTESSYQLCRHLALQQSAVRVLTTDANGLTKVLDVDKNNEVELAIGLHVRYCKRQVCHSVSLELLHLLPSYVRWADVVHLTAVYSFPTIPTLLICKSFGKPIVWSPRGSLQRWKGSKKLWTKAVWEALCQTVKPKKLILHVTSEEEASQSTERLPSLRAVVIPNGVGIPKQVSPAYDKDCLKLLYLGRLHPIKGIENLLDACSLVNRRTSLNWSLTIAGSGERSYSHALRSQIDALRLSDRVSMVGEVTEGAKLSLFESSAVTIVPSFTENFGLVVAEALAHGVPVIASRGTPWKRLDEMGCGLWVENTPEDLAKAIDQISRMPLGEMGQRGREWMKKDFSWDKRAQEVRAIYKSMCV